MSQSLSLLRATRESTADGILVVDHDSKILSANRKFHEMWSLPAEVVASGRDGDALRHVLPQLKDPDAFLTRVRELYAQPEIESFDLVEFKDGRVFERFSQPQRIEGRSVGRVWSFRDITSRLRAEEALRDRDEQLRQAQKLEAIGLLAGGVAHDFNNLLTGITCYSELALKTLAANDPVRPGIEEIRKCGERATLLTRQLLAFGRKQVMQPKVIDLDAVVAETSEMLRRTIGEHIELVTLHDAPALTVKADPGQLEQVIMNLAINARDAMPGGGRLTIETLRYDWAEAGHGDDAGLGPGSYAVLQVTDTGTGMDEATSARVFEPFFTTKELGRGTGLGLATVYGIVRQSGGNISVDSELGRGTTFRVYLPRVEESVDCTAPAAMPSAAAVRGCETVLLVEDECSVRQLVSEVLRSNGYTVLEAADGIEAVRACEPEGLAIELLVTDVVMPRMSGQDLARRIATLRPTIRVLYMSGYAESSVLKNALQNPAASFIQKPFTPDAMARKVRELLDLEVLPAASGSPLRAAGWR
ncbi:MAG: response regulator [Planctomycetota bacterium]